MQIPDIKAESMLSILTAAETEMYENSRMREDSSELKERLAKLTEEREHLLMLNKQASKEIEQFSQLIDALEEDKNTLKIECELERRKREALEKESDCTFKNQQEEITGLKKLVDTLRKQ